MINKDNSLFFMNNMQEVQEEFEIEGIGKFRYPKGHEKEGQKIPWILKIVHVDKIEKFTKLCTSTKLKNGKKETQIDTTRLGELIFAESIVYPDLKDTQLQKSFECIDNVSLLKKILILSPDYARVFNESNKINNMRDDEIVEEAKN